MAYPTREIISLQIGHYSNFVGSHWWNLQQASFCFDSTVPLEDNCINHDILFREGKTLSGESTFTPRLIAFDLKQRMGTLKKDGVLYDSLNQASSIPWQEQLIIERSEKVKPNSFLRDIARDEGLLVDEDDDEECQAKMDVDNNQKHEGDELKEAGEVHPKRMKYDLDEYVNVWSDFLNVHFHPKTMCLIDNVLPDNAKNTADSFVLGQTIVKGSVSDETEDKLHFFSEECDHLQAFQLFMDPYDQFAGISTHVLEMIMDDFSAKSVLCYSFIPTMFKKNELIDNNYRILSSLVSYASVCDHSSLLVPLSCSESLWRRPEVAVTVPYLDYKTNLNYHTSAILAAVLDTATMPLRTKTETVDVSDICSSLANGSRKVASCVGSLPLPLSDDVPLLDYLMGLDRLPWQSFSSLGPKSQCTDPQIQQLVVRGVKGSLMRKKEYKDLSRMLSYCHTSADLLNMYLKESMPTTRSYTRSFNQGVNTRDPFPHIFSPEINVNGHLLSSEKRSNSAVEVVAAVGGLQSHSATGQFLRTLVDEAKTINLKCMAGFFDQTFEKDNFDECVEKILTVIDDYRDERRSDPDSDNDDA